MENNNRFPCSSRLKKTPETLINDFDIMNIGIHHSYNKLHIYLSLLFTNKSEFPLNIGHDITHCITRRGTCKTFLILSVFISVKSVDYDIRMYIMMHTGL